VSESYVTVDRQAYEALQKEVVQLRSQRDLAASVVDRVAAHVPGAIFQFTSQGDLWRVDYVSEGIEDLAGISAAEMMVDVQNFIDRVHPDDLEAYHQSIVAAIDKGRDWFYEGRLIKPDGEVRWWQGRSTPICNDAGEMVFCGILLDVTDRVLVEISLQEAKADLEAEIRWRTAQLQESQTQLEAILTHSPAAIFLKDLEGRYLFANPPCERALGRKVEEILGKTDADLMPEEIKNHVRSGDRKAIETRSAVELEETILQPDGFHTYLAIKFPLFDSDGKVYATGGISTDISDRKRAETERDRFFNLSPDLLCVAGFDGYFKRINPAFSKVLGYSEAELKSRPFVDFVHPDDRAATLAEAQKVARGQETVQFENRYRCRDGSYRWLSWSSIPYPEEEILYATARDITDAKLAEDRLRRSQQRLSLLVQQTPLAVIEWDLDWKVTTWNPAAERIFGWTRWEALGRPVVGLLIPETARPHVEKVMRDLVAQQGGSRSTNENLTKDGRIITCEWYNTPLVSTEGNLIGVASMAFDITERETAEAALRASEARFQKLAANLPGVIYQFRMDAEGSMSFLFASAGCRELYEIEPEQMERSLEMTHADDRPGMMAEIARSARTLEPFDWQGRIITTSGRLKWVRVISRPDRQGDGSVIWDGMIIDISERILAEDERQKFVALIENSTDFIGMAAPGGRALYLNQAGRELLGLESLEAVKNATIFDFVPAADIASLRQALGSVRDGANWQGEFHLQHFQTAEEIPVEMTLFAVRDRETDELLCYATISRDIRDRKEAEADRDRLLAILEATTDFISTSSTEGEISYINRSGREILGIERDRPLEGCRLSHLHPAWAYNILMQEALFEAARTGYWMGETAMLAADGREIPFSQAIVAHKSTDGTIAYFSTIARDITSLKETERTLLVYRQAIESASDAIAFTDADGNHIYQNPAFSRLFECATVDEFNASGGIPAVFVDPELPAKFLKTVLENGESWREEIELRSFGDRLMPVSQRANPIVDSENNIIGLVVAMTDISDRKQAEAKLQRTTRNLQQAQRLASIGNWEFEVATQSLEWSDEVFRIFRRNPALGTPDVPESLEYYHADDRDLLQAAFSRCITTATPCELELRTLLGEGVTGYAHIKVEAIRDDSSEVARLFGTVMDITERKKAEIQLQQQTRDLENALRELQQTQTQLLQSEKMSSLGQLVAGVAHEINNPVNFIYGNLIHAKEYTEDLLEVVTAYQKHYSDPEPDIAELIEEVELDFLIEDLPHSIQSMLVGAKRIREIVLSLRNFSRLDEAECKEADIHEGIDSTLMILQNRIKGRGDRAAIKIVKNYNNLPKLLCYPGQLNQVFMNVLSNAIDALEERDKHRTLAETKSDPSQIEITTELEDDGWVRVRLQDNGPGIPDTVKNRIFDPFFTTKEVGKGTGLGMSISYQIVVEKHGGHIECLSSLGAGATFIIELPPKPPQDKK